MTIRDTRRHFQFDKFWLATVTIWMLTATRLTFSRRSSRSEIKSVRLRANERGAIHISFRP